MTAQCPRFQGDHCARFNCAACEGYETRADAIQAQAAHRLHALVSAADALEQRRRRIARAEVAAAGLTLARGELDSLLDAMRSDARSHAWEAWHIELEAALVEVDGARARCDAWAREAARRWIAARAMGAVSVAEGSGK